MNLELVGKDVTPSETLRGRLESKLGKIEKRLGEKLFVRVSLKTADKHTYSCGIHFNGAGHEFSAAATSDDLIKATDEAVDKVSRQVSKHQDRPESQRKASATIRGGF